MRRAWPRATRVGAALEALEGAGVSGEGAAGGALGGDVDVFCYEEVVGAPPEFGFDAAHAAETPLVVDEGIDARAG
jgi:hypothetical protein